MGRIMPYKKANSLYSKLFITSNVIFYNNEAEK